MGSYVWVRSPRGRVAGGLRGPDHVREAEFGRRRGGAADGRLTVEVPDRYARFDPSLLPTPAAPVTLLHGTADDRVPIEMSRSYAARTGAVLARTA